MRTKKKEEDDCELRKEKRGNKMICILWNNIFKNLVTHFTMTQSDTEQQKVIYAKRVAATCIKCNFNLRKNRTIKRQNVRRK